MRAPGGRAADLAEDGLAVGLAVPLHVGEAGLEAERLEHRAGPAASALERRLVEVAQRHRLRADPLHGAAESGRGRYQATL